MIKNINKIKVIEKSMVDFGSCQELDKKELTELRGMSERCW
jgi:hypothetical protein